MNAKTARTSNLRDEYVAQTRARILTALLELLKDKKFEDISYLDLATQARVAERTVYRHFPSKSELIRSAGQWIDETIFETDDFLQSDIIEDVPKIFRQIVRRNDEVPHLADIAAMCRVLADESSPVRKRVADNIRNGLKPYVEGLESDRKIMAEAAVYFFSSIMMWKMLRKEFGFSADQTADAHEWIFSLIVEDLKRRRQTA